MFAIELENVWKEFSLERKKELTLKERFVNLGKRRETERVIALRNINLSIKRGECFGILGKNGAGKTTLLKIIAGILKPDRGRIIIRGNVVPILSLGLGFEKELTAKENVYLYGSVLGLSKREIDEKYEKIVEFSELENVMNVKLRDFSDGMVMRLSFSIAFHVDCDIILIDEVLAVGDAAFQRKCLDRIKELKKEGRTIVIVSHSVDDIKRFCDRALILDKGKIVFLGKVLKVCEKYEEMIESERLKRINEMLMEENGIYFDAFCEERFILKRGKRCKIELKSGNLGNSVELWFEGKDHVRLFTKNFKKNKLVFQTNSFPLSPGTYDVWVRRDGKIMVKKPFKILVKDFQESTETIAYMSPDSKSPFKDLTLVFGRNSELEMKKFERGKTLFVFEDLNRVAGRNECSLFKGNRLVMKGQKESVLNRFKEEVWKGLAIEYFSDILEETQLGRSLMRV